MDIKVLLGVFSIIVASLGYPAYVINILRRKTKPHAFSWLVWSAIAIVGFGIQVDGHGGPGAWLLGAAATSTFSIFVLSLFYGHRDIQSADKISLGVAAVAFAFWIGTDQPIIAAALITFIEAIGAFFPTFRKSYQHPYEETLFTYATYAISIALSLMALENYALANVLYPAADLMLYVSLVVFVLVRRSRIKAPQK